MSNKKYTDENLLDALIVLREVSGKWPMVKNMKGKTPCLDTYSRRFAHDGKKYNGFSAAIKKASTRYIVNTHIPVKGSDCFMIPPKKNTVCKRIVRNVNTKLMAFKKWVTRL